MCGSAGCTLPRTHHGSCCRPEILLGKRERKPSVKVKEGAGDVEEAGTAHTCAAKSRAGSSKAVSDRVFATRCPRITVWYSQDGKVEAYHGVVMRVCRLNGLLVKFINGGDDEYWVSKTEDEFAWGHAYADGLSTAPNLGIARARPPARHLNEQALVAFAAASNVGGRAWPEAWQSCMATLQLLRWQLCAAEWLKRAVPLALEVVGERSESSVDERGLTHLVDAAVMLLGQVPKRSWRSIVDWPAKGDWSSRLRTAHTPEALQAAVEMAMARVVRWPEAKSRAVRIRLSGYAGSHGELICNDQPLPNGASMIAACCFACGHKNALGQHPRIPRLRVCGVCAQRFERSDWSRDDELLGNRCAGCAHKGCARHGCRSCGASLCERCLYVIHGSAALGRMRRFTIDATCPACGLEGDEAAPPGLDKRVVCDGCHQEWHPRCHAPPLTLPLPGASAKWLCADCIVAGVPKVASWSLSSCALCEQRSDTLHRPGLRVEHSYYRPFDHSMAVKRLNSSVDATNTALANSGRLMSDAALRELATSAAAAGGLVVLSICDGKGSLLGMLLRAGVRVRRYLSVEIDEGARRVCHCNYGSGNHELLAHDALRFFPDARTITIADLKELDCWPVDLASGGTPCNDLSACNAVANGVDGAQSNLIYDFVTLVCEELSQNNDGRPLAMMWENVVPNSIQARKDVLALFGMPALTSEGAVFEAARRLRWFITNLRLERISDGILDKKLQGVLNPGAKALADKAGCIISGTISGVSGETLASARAHSQRHRGRELVQCAAHSMDVRGLLVSEMCRAMGQPYYEVDAAPGGESAKAGLVGRSFAEGQVRHVLQALIRACLEAQKAHTVRPYLGENPGCASPAT